MVMRLADAVPSGALVTFTLTLVPGFNIEASPGNCATTGTLAGTSNSVSPTQPLPAPPGASADRPVQLAAPGAPAPWKVSLMTGAPLPPLTLATVASVMTSLTVALVMVWPGWAMGNCPSPPGAEKMRISLARSLPSGPRVPPDAIKSPGLMSASVLGTLTVIRVAG